ncbi:MAG: hypothetical protein KKH97_08095 [Proteobacteria bacterium]|nr:hypothetical protein [Pseudomonadota bacterium]
MDDINTKDRRSDLRYSTESSLICRLFPSDNNHNAKAFDHSNTGISFKSNHEFKSGTVVYIRRESCPPKCPAGEACKICRPITIATIKWCELVENACTSSYLAGAKYLGVYGMGF